MYVQVWMVQWYHLHLRLNCYHHLQISQPVLACRSLVLPSHIIYFKVIIQPHKTLSNSCRDVNETFLLRLIHLKFKDQVARKMCQAGLKTKMCKTKTTPLISRIGLYFSVVKSSWLYYVCMQSCGQSYSLCTLLMKYWCDYFWFVAGISDC